MAGTGQAHLRPIDADIPFFFGVITRDAREPSPAALAFVQALADAAQALLPDYVQHAATEHAQVLQSLYGDLPAPKEASSS